MTQTILKFENVSKNYNNLVALDQINLSVEEKEIIGLIGPNGAGKTTALKLIGRLIRPTFGRVLIKNHQGNLQDINLGAKNLIEMGFLIDIPHFYNTNPVSLLRLIANVRDFPKSQIEQRINELLKSFDMYKWKYKKLKTFSKGMIQKIGFLTAIIHDPEILILDEPQTGLDPSARIIIREYIRSFKKEGKTVVVSSHLLDELRELCDKVALLNEGKLIGYDTIDNLEIEFKTKELVCEIENPIPQEKLHNLLSKLEEHFAPYLEKNQDNFTESNMIRYNSEKNCFFIKYNGTKSAKREILEILTEKFTNNFKITSFFEPKVSQLERIYSKMVNKEKFNQEEIKK